MTICQGKLTKLDTGWHILVIKRGFRKLLINENCDILYTNNVFFFRVKGRSVKKLKKISISAL
jgi:hypothetical protein